MPSTSVTIAPGSYKLQYFNFYTESGNILPLKKHDPASVDTRPFYRIGGRRLSEKSIGSLNYIQNQLKNMNCLCNHHIWTSMKSGADDEKQVSQRANYRK